jgi:hypothetical protein
MSNEGQKAAYERLKEHPVIQARWNAYCRDLYTQTNFYKESGRYRLFAPGNLGKGDLNVYRMFVETALSGVRRGGCAAQLVPEGFYNGANAAAIRAGIFERFRLDRLIGFENSRGVWFPSVHTAAKFCLYVAWKGGSTESFEAAFHVNSEQRLADAVGGRHLTLPVSLVANSPPTPWPSWNLQHSLKSMFVATCTPAIRHSVRGSRECRTGRTWQRSTWATTAVSSPRTQMGSRCYKVIRWTSMTIVPKGTPLEEVEQRCGSICRSAIREKRFCRNGAFRRTESRIN